MLLRSAETSMPIDLNAVKSLVGERSFSDFGGGAVDNKTERPLFQPRSNKDAKNFCRLRYRHSGIFIGIL